MVVVWSSFAGSHATLSISDTLGSTWTKAVDKTQHCIVWIAKVPSTGANTVTVTITGATDWQGMAIAEYSCSGATAYTVDGTVTNTGTGQNTTSGSIPVSGSNELVISGLSQGSFTLSDTPGTGFTQASANTNASTGCGAYQDYALNVSTAQNNNTSFAFNGGQTWYAASCSIVATGGGGAVKFRRSLSQFGTKVGSRQVLGI